MSSNPHNIKVIFLDVDGTLYSHATRTIPASAREALAQARAAGIKTVIATGRHKVDLKKLPTANMDFDGYLALNGQMVLDNTMHLIAGTPIKADEAKILAMAFKAEKIPFLILTEDDKYMNYIDTLAQGAVDDGSCILPEPREFEDSGQAIFQLCAFVDDEKRELLTNILEECDVTSWHASGIDIVPKGGGKDVGIAKFLEAEGIPRSQTMAFGDGENDISMLEFVEIGVAMGNATEATKRAADYVTTDIDEDGIANALRHFGIVD